MVLGEIVKLRENSTLVQGIGGNVDFQILSSVLLRCSGRILREAPSCWLE